MNTNDKPTPPPEATGETARTTVPTNYPWLETARFLPDSTETMLLAWVRGDHITYRTGRYLGGKFIGTSRDEFRTQPNYFREVTGLFNLPDEGDKLRAEISALTSKLAELTKERGELKERLQNTVSGMGCATHAELQETFKTVETILALHSALTAKTLETDGLRKALMFYAESKNYTRTGWQGDQYAAAIETDGGEIARKALSVGEAGKL